MGKKKQEFVPYKNYGLGHTNNLVLSFIDMYGKTYASNKYISERLDISISTITRSINKLQKGGYIEISNPNGRSRFIKMITQPNQNDHQPNQIDEGGGQNDEVNLIKLTNNNKENNKLNNKVNNKEYNKLEIIEIGNKESNVEVKKLLKTIESAENNTVKREILKYYKHLSEGDELQHKNNLVEYYASIELIENHKELFQELFQEYI